jgi:hypothetical protein
MSATDDEFGPDAPEQRPAPEVGELQLRKALSTMNDLEPPRDDLFAQRAIIRGRARTSRRRSTVLGAAAALVVVGAVGTTWLATNHNSTASSTSAGSAAEAQKDTDAAGGSGSNPQSLGGPNRTVGPEGPPAVVSGRDASTWFGALATPQTAAFGTVEQTLVSRWPDVFSGAYAADAAGSRIVVAVTRRDPALEALVTGAMPSPGDVEFVVARHSYAEKARVLQEISDQRAAWRAKGVEVIGVTMDGRGDAVVVLADEGGSPGLVAQRYGDLVRVVPSKAGPTGKLPDGTTLPTLEQ